MNSTAASPIPTHSALAQYGRSSTSASMAATPTAFTTTGAASATTCGPILNMTAPATSVSSGPKMVSTGIMGLPRLAIAQPTVSPATAAGSKQANTMSTSATRNCTGP